MNQGLSLAVDFAGLHSLEGKTWDDLCGYIIFQVNMEFKNDVKGRNWGFKTVQGEKSRLGWTG